MSEERNSAGSTGVTANVVKEVLPNGLTVLVKESRNAPVAAVVVHFHVGYFQEEDRHNGIAHVIEHMVFKGTPSRPDQNQYAREIQELGGTLNASTGYEDTIYYVVVPKDALPQAIEVQADALQNFMIDPEELGREIEVIVQEAEQKRDNPNAMLIESFYALAFDRHRIRRWRMGEAETLRGFRRENLREFLVANYLAHNITVAVVGDIDTAEAIRLVTDYWGSLPVVEKPRSLSPEEPERIGFRYRRTTGETRQRLLVFGFPAPPFLHPDGAALSVLSALLSDGRSARLYRRLKEEQQVVSSAWASYDGMEQMGLFTLGAEVTADDPLAAECALWTEIRNLQTDPPGQDELERIKTRLEMRRLTAQEEVMGIARTLTTYEVRGGYRLADELVEQVMAVTPRDVQRVAAAYFDLSRASLIEYLPSAVDVQERSAAQVEAALRQVPSSSPVKEGIPTADSALSDSGLTKVIALPGGATLYFRQRQDLPLISVEAAFQGGRRRETRANCGITNLMAKSMLKGTTTRDAETLANQIEGLGSGIGSNVGGDSFHFGIKLKRDVLQEGFAIFADVLANPTFPEAEIEREKQTIYAALRRKQDNGYVLTYDFCMEVCFGEQSYGLPSTGEAQAISLLTAGDLRHWHQEHLVSGNLHLGIVGDLTEAEAVALSTDLLPGGPAIATVSPPVHYQPYGEQVVSRNRQQTSAFLSFRGAALDNEDRYALDVLGEIAAGLNGRFMQAVRGTNGLAYTVMAAHWTRREAGNFIAYTSTAPENELRARELLLAECERFRAEPVTAKELLTAKAAIEGRYVIGMQSFDAQASELAELCVSGFGPEEPQRYLARIEQITAEQVQDVAKRYFAEEGCWLGVLRGGVAETIEG